MSRQRFVWKALDENGKMQRGTWEGLDSTSVQARLRDAGYFPVRIRPQWNGRNLYFRPQYLYWSHFSRRLATLLEAGIPLLQALDMMTDSGTKLTPGQNQWRDIKARVEAGQDLSDALTCSSPPPNAFVLSMIKAGEQTGTLGKVLGEVADELEQEHFYRQKIKGALAYPALLFIAVIVVISFLSIWVLPMYEKLFRSMGADLPFLTKVIFAVGQKLPYLWWSGLGLITVSVLVLGFKGSRGWRAPLERVFGHVPLVGRIYLLRDLVQFSRILGRLLDAGIPLLEALHLTMGTLRHSGMLSLIHQLMANVRQGKRMAPLMRASQVFPKAATEMIAIAEETGQLDRMLRAMTQLFRRELEEQLDRFTRMLEPTLILGLAGVIGLVAGGVLLPIFDLSSRIQ